ncbi:RUN and FYVE domain-containing protein 2 [Lamellibrachia satsuma]|nr:RUN and FYVE domain-containing protein 2 [Lamellibrachia satsuma]
MHVHAIGAIVCYGSTKALALDIARSALETDLKIEREWRGTLQRNLEQEKERVAGLQEDMRLLQTTRKEFDQLQTKHIQLQTVCEEQEKALSELGSHLSESKLKVEDMKEMQAVNREAQWTEDKVVAACRQCERPFSVSRRKHHCRSCGEIFCNDCSDTKMSLPSSAKPERVCDACHAVLLQRYSAN